MKKVFGYIRVSTVKQGQQGVSLQEQRDAISRYCQRQGWELSEWFEERQTAAKRGRPVFGRMLKLLGHGKADGVVIHKIDRSARNLKDWANLGEMIDTGVDVSFVTDGLDLRSRGGRLSADIQAVVAADYIRNLREETRKGFYGRLKQGLYPLPAPLGYLDQGKGKPKVLDPVKASLVRQAFELYGTNRYNLHGLLNELRRLGLRNHRDQPLSLTGLCTILHNPFYIGLIRVCRTKELFPGVHAPLISKSLFDRVQSILSGKTNTRSQRHDFLFRRLLTCEHCGLALIGERQKGHVYYRCHSRNCPTTGIREERVSAVFADFLARLRFSEREQQYLAQQVAKLKETAAEQQQTMIQNLALQLETSKSSLNRLTDAYLDQALDRNTFEERKAAILLKRREIEEQIEMLNNNPTYISTAVQEILELANAAQLSYEMATTLEKRDLVQRLTSNRIVGPKKLELATAFPFELIANRAEYACSPPYRNTPRTSKTLAQILARVIEHCRNKVPEVPTSTE